MKSRALLFERLENRVVLDASGLGFLGGLEVADIQPHVVAGDPNGSPADSPSLRADANVSSSTYAGVGSLFLRQGNGPRGFVCTATPIAADYLLTAGHCVDNNDDGIADFDPAKVTFYLNYNGDTSHSVTAQNIYVNPEYTGFNNPAVNDDLAIIQTSAPIPAASPYDLHRAPLSAGDRIDVVGYGQSGDGVNGYTVGASLTVKRDGANIVDGFEPEDDAGGSGAEVYLADFDGPSGNGPMGGSTLGNDVETTLGGGDSGGPAFYNGKVVAVNTFSFRFGLNAPSAPLFGSGFGGILIYEYLDWIDNILAGNGGGNDGGGGPGGGNGGGNGGGKGKKLGLAESPEFVLASSLLPTTLATEVERPADDTDNSPLRPAGTDWLVTDVEPLTAVETQQPLQQQRTPRDDAREQLFALLATGLQSLTLGEELL